MTKYRYLTKPYRHQVLALKKMLRNGFGGALLMEPRTGKSKVVIDWLSILYMQNKVDRALIVCPPNVISVWEDEFNKHCPYEYDIFVWDRNKRIKGGLPEPTKNRLLVVLVNYETFAMPGKKLPSGRRSTTTGRIHHRNEIRRWTTPKTAGVLDESHIIKTSSARTHTTLVSLHRDLPYRAIMTGTVVTKSSRAHDIRNQWQFLNPERFARWETQDEFKNYFGIWKEIPDVPVKVWRKGKNLDELHKLMMQDSFSITRDECFDLPKSDTQVVEVTLSRAAKVYDQMATRMVAEFRQHTAEASYPIVKVLRLAQITGGFITTDKGVVARVGTEKLDAITPYLAQIVEYGERVIVVARFKPELDALYKLCQSFKVPVFQIRGGMKRQQVTLDRKKAEQSKGPLIYVVQPHAAGLGIDLSFASRMMWYSLPTSYVHFRQCSDRIALSRKSTTFTYFLSSGIDQLMYKALQSDGRFLEAIRQDPERLLRA